MSIIGNPIMAGASGPAASIFVTGLSQTDTVTATNGSKTKVGVWTQKPNPAYVVPDGYTQLEYIKSTGTQYIKTNFQVKSTIGYEVDFALVNTSGETGIIGGFTYGGYHHMFGTSGNKWRAYYGNADGSNFGTTDTSRHVIEQNVTAGVVKLDGVQQLSGLTFYNNTSRNVNLFCFDGGSSYPTHQIGALVLYSAKIYDSGTLVGNLTPCKRNSDGVIGMYDVISDVFYTNAGTGTFTAGPEIPQTIGGFMIKPIRDLGTWTITATDGIETYTQDVLVDVITEYEIEITKKLYLYRDGDECEDVTGGWTSAGYARTNYTITSATKNNDSFYASTNGGYQYNMLGTANSIDFSKFEKICALVNITNCNTDNPIMLYVWETKTFSTSGVLAETYNQTGEKLLTINIKDCDYTSGYINVGSWDNRGSGNIYKVWLE